ncbi:hypothetical protein [Psychrobacillus phage Perkons]|nr:hypothetical protein [Psychrobacillus phage Perkons]
MENTSMLNLKIVTNTSFETDDIKQTIVEYGKNFEKLEYAVSDTGSNINDLIVGNKYEIAKKVWNSSPVSNGYVGWVNLRKGLYAPTWEALKSYSVDDLVRAIPDNGNVYKCITNGRSMRHTPNFLTNPNVEFYDANGNQWMSNYNYEVDDVVFATDGSVIYYFICETAGLSSITEPNWNTVPVGTTNIDGSVVWRKEKTVKWKQVDSSCNFKPFGKIE